MLAQRDGIPAGMSSREINVAPDKYEVVAGDIVLVTELESAIAVCIYDAQEEAGALLHLRCIVRTSRPIDVTDTTLATELLLLDRCLATLREAVPQARHLQARVVVHLTEAAQAAASCETIMQLLQHYLTDGGVRVLPEDVAAGPARLLRFRPAMGWVHARA
jgi:chemotaxis receptor (MCP) glutamine deamidase CheD